MMYEIINPSDKCFVSAERDEGAAIVGLLLGNGMYGMRDGQRVVLPIIFNGWREWFLKTYGAEIEPWMLEHAAEIAAALDTFEYAAERSSMNNIGATAKDHAAWLWTIAGGMP